MDRAETTNVALENARVVAEIARLAMGGFLDGRTAAGPVRPNSGNEPQIDLLKKLATLAKY